MNKINFLGTGCAMVTNCFNTCFTIKNNKNEYMLVDTGGGNTILNNLIKSDISILDIKALFISHTHNDHITGISWIVRAIAVQLNKGNYKGNFNIYGEKSVLDACRTICMISLGKKFTKHFDNNIKFIPIENDETLSILDHEIIFFNIESTKCLQYGFKMETDNNNSICFLGDEPYKDHLKKYAKDSDYLIHEAFCLYDERDTFKPYEKHHSTVKECCENAEMLNCKNLIIIHTQDNDIKNRKKKYTEEGSKFCSCNILVPDDLECIDIK